MSDTPPSALAVLADTLSGLSMTVVKSLPGWMARTLSVALSILGILWGVDSYLDKAPSKAVRDRLTAPAPVLVSGPTPDIADLRNRIADLAAQGQTTQDLVVGLGIRMAPATTDPAPVVGSKPKPRKAVPVASDQPFPQPLVTPSWP